MFYEFVFFDFGGLNFSLKCKISGVLLFIFVILLS